MNYSTCLNNSGIAGYKTININLFIFCSPIPYKQCLNLTVNNLDLTAKELCEGGR